jgi:predicted O-methyltransferase YrrM
MELDEYILAHSDAEPENLRRLGRDVHLRLLYPRMCSGHLQGRVLKMLTAMIAPKRALEIGTYAGYSALCIAEGLPDGGHLDTVEIDDEMEDFIRAQFARSPYGERITLHIGDIATVAPTLVGAYDMVYMDANKRTYLETFNQIRPMVKRGGFILADNTLWDGKVINQAENHDAQTVGISRFNDVIAADSTLEKVILPLRDGLTLIRVKE